MVTASEIAKNITGNERSTVLHELVATKTGLFSELSDDILKAASEIDAPLQCTKALTEQYL